MLDYVPVNKKPSWAYYTYYTLCYIAVFVYC